MFSYFKAALLIAIMAVLLISACNSPAADNPDANTIYTQVASTVQAQLTTGAARVPSATNTPVPRPTDTIPALPPGVTNPAIPVVEPSVPAPTLTVSIPDRGAWVSNTPADGSVVLSGSNILITWVVKNTGTTIWNTNYSFRYYAGERLGASNIQLPKSVKPGEEAQLPVTMQAPTKSGSYNSIWVLTNDQGQNFYSVNITLKVDASAATSTPGTPTEETATITLTPLHATATVTPTITSTTKP